MKVFRSVLGIVVGVILAGLATSVAHAVGHLVYPPPEEMRDNEAFKKLLAEPVELKRVLDTLPTGAFVSVLLSWQLGAFIGAAAAALIAGYGRVVHAGIIGAFVLLESVMMMMMIPHPDWMKVLGLVLPLPVSMLAGKLVSILFASPATTVHATPSRDDAHSPQPGSEAGGGFRSGTP